MVVLIVMPHLGPIYQTSIIMPVAVCLLRLSLPFSLHIILIAPPDLFPQLGPQRQLRSRRTARSCREAGTACATGCWVAGSAYGTTSSRPPSCSAPRTSSPHPSLRCDPGLGFVAMLSPKPSNTQSHPSPRCLHRSELRA